MSIHNRAVEAYRFQIEKAFKESNHHPQTVQGLFDFLCDEEEHFIVYHYDDIYHEKTTLKQRLNRMWIMPLYLCIAPFKWLITGTMGIHPHTKLAKWVAKATGL